MLSPTLPPTLSCGFWVACCFVWYNLLIPDVYLRFFLFVCCCVTLRCLAASLASPDRFSHPHSPLIFLSSTHFRSLTNPPFANLKQVNNVFAVTHNPGITCSQVDTEASSILSYGSLINYENSPTCTAPVNCPNINVRSPSWVVCGVCLLWIFCCCQRLWLCGRVLCQRACVLVVVGSLRGLRLVCLNSVVPTDGCTC